MICSQGGRGGISRGVFCPKIPGNENQVNVQAKAKKQGFFIKFFPLIPKYLGRIKIIRIKRVRSIKVFSNSLCGGVIKGKGSRPAYTHDPRGQSDFGSVRPW